MLKNKTKKITVLGIGNSIYSDEGIGIRTLPMLEEAFKDAEDVEIIEGATDGMRLLGVVEDTDYLIILDAINAGVESGEVITLQNEEIPAYYGIKMSVHQIGFQELLAVADLRERLPKHMVMFGVQPKVLALGVDLSEIVEEKIPHLVSLVEKQVHEWRQEV